MIATRSQYRLCPLSCLDRLPIMNRLAALRLVESSRSPIVAWVAGIIDRSRSRTHLQIVLHPKLHHLRIAVWPAHRIIRTKREQPTTLF